MTSAREPTGSRWRIALPLLVLAALSLWLASREAGGADPEGTAPAVDRGLFSATDLESARSRAQTERRLILIDFYARWCGPCRELELTTWHDPAVRSWIQEHAVALAVDTDVESGLAARFGVRVLPTLLFLDSGGTEVRRFTGYRDAAQFLTEAHDVLREAGG